MQNFFLGIYLQIWGCILALAGGFTIAGEISGIVVFIIGVLFLFKRERPKYPSPSDFKRGLRDPSSYQDRYWKDTSE